MRTVTANHLRRGDRFFYEGRRHTCAGPVIDVTRGWVLPVKHAGEIWMGKGTEVQLYHEATPEQLGEAG